MAEYQALIIGMATAREMEITRPKYEESIQSKEALHATATCARGLTLRFPSTLNKYRRVNALVVPSNQT